jgi:hypothetical protein
MARPAVSLLNSAGIVDLAALLERERKSAVLSARQIRRAHEDRAKSAIHAAKQPPP